MIKDMDEPIVDEPLVSGMKNHTNTPMAKQNTAKKMYVLVVMSVTMNTFPSHC